MYVERSTQSDGFTIHDFDLRLDRLQNGLLIHVLRDRCKTITHCFLSRVVDFVPGEIRVFSGSALRRVAAEVRAERGFLLALNGLSGVFADLTSVPQEMMFGVFRDARKEDRLLDFELLRMALSPEDRSWNDLRGLTRALGVDGETDQSGLEREMAIVVESYLAVVHLLRDLPTKEVNAVGGRYAVLPRETAVMQRAERTVVIDAETISVKSISLFEAPRE